MGWYLWHKTLLLELFWKRRYRKSKYNTENISILCIFAAYISRKQFNWGCTILQKMHFVNRGNILDFTQLINSVNRWGIKFAIHTYKSTRAPLIKLFLLWLNSALPRQLRLMVRALLNDGKCWSTAGMRSLNLATHIFTQVQQLWGLM